MIDLDGPPSRWVPRHGKPASAVPHDGLASFETDRGDLAVYDLLIAFKVAASARSFGRVAGIEKAQYMLFSRGYGAAAIRAKIVGDHELVALHDDPDALWQWRPLAYRLSGNGVDRLGSQQELEWRWGLAEVETASIELAGDLDDFVRGQVLGVKARYGRVPPAALAPGETGFRLPKNARKRMYREYVKLVERRNAARPQLDFFTANERADRILREHLGPQQLLDLRAWGRFYVRGTINPLYQVELGNGAAIVSPYSGVPWVSLCLHPERWMPHADVALATKMLIESGPEGEEEMLAGARARMLPHGPLPSRAERYCWDRMRELLPAPLAEVVR